MSRSINTKIFICFHGVLSKKNHAISGEKISLNLNESFKFYFARIPIRKSNFELTSRSFVGE